MYSSTRVVFPDRCSEATARILDVRRLPPSAPAPSDTDGPSGVPAGAWWVIADLTPFHPVDHTWPDQPGDSGHLEVGGVRLPVADCLTAARSVDGGPVHVGRDIPVRRGGEGHHWYAAHVLDAELDDGEARDLIGERAELRVDVPRRQALSAAHSACHLVGLGLNAALRDLWRKPVAVDGLGRPDFDGMAIASSRLTESGSTDVHRLGSSLRRRGFVATDLGERLADVQAEVSATVSGWLAADAPIAVGTNGDRLEDRRTWECTLPEGTHRTWCGGTHPERTGDVEVTAVALALAEDAKTLTVTTRTSVRGGKPWQ
ncbi:hypothetical protein [Actinacidiphila paucisporea]|nr:hypothetical protein [Actinacidiphila paucisporea]